MWPTTGSRLTGPGGNNTFAYKQRKRTDPEPKLRLPNERVIKSIDEITLGTHTTFTELDTNDNIVTYTGLEHLYTLPQDKTTSLPMIHIFDNHNYALYFRGIYWEKERHSLPVIHIDQHSDLGIPPSPFDHTGRVSDNIEDFSNQLAHYTTHTCNVGNFIRPALNAGFIAESLWIKNQYDLEHFPFLQDGRYPCLQNHTPCKKGGWGDYILDIDLDFRTPAMDTDLHTTLPIVKTLMAHASLITIASSPYFLDQQLALDLLHKLFAS